MKFRNAPSKKKIQFPVSEQLLVYMEKINRLIPLPTHYKDLLRYNVSVPLIDLAGNNTYWETVYYSENDTADLNKALTSIYALLKTEGDILGMEHLAVSRVDFCTFGNTQPFRVRIVNKLNDNYDHFYIKKTDASRVYGLELENLLSPNYIDFLIDGETLIESHIPGIPGDIFVEKHLDDTPFNQIRIAKEFVKFNERCFVRLLGDMRAYNYVVDITPDIEGSQFRLRAIDFDQQSYEGRKNFYLPQYFKENNPIVFLGIRHMSPQTVSQYQKEERSLIAARIKTFESRVSELLNIMVKDTISFPEKVAQLKADLSYHHKDNGFLNCKTMGEIVFRNIELLLSKDFKQSFVQLNVLET